MSAPEKLTPRQLEALVNVYCGDHHSARRTYPTDGDSVLDGPASERPAWGKRRAYDRASSMGGASYRMILALSECGFFPIRYSAGGTPLPQTRTLTAKALRALKARYPELPQIDDRLAARELVEAQEADYAEAERVARRERGEAERARWSRERRDRMAAVLLEFQVLHQLTPDQLEAMWVRIVEEDSAL